jgi:hypothetical protein
MAHRTFIDAEDLVLAWVKTTSVAPLVTVSGSVKIFLGMPQGSPLPCVVLSRVGGGPDDGDSPVDHARISFSVYSANRPQCKSITSALVSEIESIGYGAPYIGVSGRLQSGIVVLNMWLPDPVDDTPRYIVDAVFPVMNN